MVLRGVNRISDVESYDAAYAVGRHDHSVFQKYSYLLDMSAVMSQLRGRPCIQLAF